jgi:hypothetical protein
VTYIFLSRQLSSKNVTRSFLRISYCYSHAFPWGAPFMFSESTLEAEFLDEIQTKVFRVSFLLITVISRLQYEKKLYVHEFGFRSPHVLVSPYCWQRRVVIRSQYLREFKPGVCILEKNEKSVSVLCLFLSVMRE